LGADGGGVWTLGAGSTALEEGSERAGGLTENAGLGFTLAALAVAAGFAAGVQAMKSATNTATNTDERCVTPSP
jgi:hypothetical protein